MNGASAQLHRQFFESTFAVAVVLECDAELEMHACQLSPWVGFELEACRTPSEFLMSAHDTDQQANRQPS